jgi:uncharacterized protein (DUF58 family)
MSQFPSRRPDEMLLRADEIPVQRRERYARRMNKRMKLNRPLTEDELHRRLRPRARRFWIAGAIVLILLGFVLHSWLLALSAILIAALGVVPEVWQRLVLRNVSFKRSFTPARVHFGEEIRYTIQIENQKRLPVPWLEIEDEFSVDLEMPSAPVYPSYKPDRQLFITSLALWTHQRVTRHYRLMPLARGVWRFGPTYLRAGDPFGFLDDERKLPELSGQTTLTVLPLVAPLARFGLPSRYPFGEVETRRRMLEDPSQITGARDYLPGDPLRRVHWKATAHQGSLQSKVYPFTTDHHLAIFLNIRTMALISEGVVSAHFELGIAAAASIATWAQHQGFAVGLFCNGIPQLSGEQQVATLADAQTFMRVPPSTHPDQLVRLLETLARLQPYFGMSFDRLLAREQTALAPGATIIVISAVAATQPDTITRLERLQRRGHTVALLLTGSGEMPSSSLLTYRLGGEETWNDLIAYARRQHPSSAIATDDPRPGGGAADAGESGADRAGAGDINVRQPTFTLG